MDHWARMRHNPFSKAGDSAIASRFAEAQQQEATLVYQRTPSSKPSARSRMRSSPIARAKSPDCSRSSCARSEDATRLSNMRYKGGATSYLEVARQ